MITHGGLPYHILDGDMGSRLVVVARKDSYSLGHSGLGKSGDVQVYRSTVGGQLSSGRA